MIMLPASFYSVTLQRGSSIRNADLHFAVSTAYLRVPTTLVRPGAELELGSELVQWDASQVKLSGRRLRSQPQLPLPLVPPNR